MKQKQREKSCAGAADCGIGPGSELKLKKGFVETFLEELKSPMTRDIRKTLLS
jgi:hypothetical protein